MSVVSLQRDDLQEDVITVQPSKKESPTVLEEEEYLGRMAKIIRRDFYGDTEFLDIPLDTPSSSRRTATTRTTDRISYATPGTDKTRVTTSSQLRDRYKACSLSLNEYLDKYTSEDNAYFEKLQKKELKRHRAKYPWLYKDKSDHNERVQDQLQLPSIREQVAIGNKDSTTKMIDWPHNPNNSLFYAPNEPASSRRSQSIINYNSNKCMSESKFKIPMQPREGSNAYRSINGFKDKIGIDGKLLNGSETPMINGYSFIPAPDTPELNIEEPKIKSEINRFYIPSESPRDELANRLYQQKVAKAIRTPRNLGHDTPSIRKTPSSRKSYADFSFSPERVKNTTKSLRHK